MSNAEGANTTESVHRPASGSARWDLACHLRLWSVALAGLALDLWSKEWAFSRLGPFEKLVVIPNLATLQRSLNTGALFGLGKGWTPVFIGASALALVFVLSLFIHSSRERRSLHVALALVLAGALGNLYDRAFQIADVVTYTNGGEDRRIEGKVIEQNERLWIIGSWPEGSEFKKIPVAWNPRLRQQGVVRDFVKMEPRFHIGSRVIDVWPWVFNVADVLLVVGVGLLMLNFWWDRRAERAARQQRDASCPVEQACESG